MTRRHPEKVHPCIVRLSDRCVELVRDGITYARDIRKALPGVNGCSISQALSLAVQEGRLTRKAEYHYALRP